MPNNNRKQTKKGTVARIEKGRIIDPVYTFKLNPSQLERSRRIRWNNMDAPGTSGSLAQFVLVEDQIIKFELLLAAKRSNSSQDVAAYESSLGVLPDLAQIESWGLPSLDQILEDNLQFVSPPRILFTYGTRAWTCELHEYNVKEELHNNRLYPIIARVGITLRTSHDTFASLKSEMANYRALRQIQETGSIANNDPLDLPSTSPFLGVDIP